MPENFSYTKNDDVVRTWLSSDDRNQIGTEQALNTYTFEFHGGHTTGFPIYIRADGDTSTSNLPKFDTRNKSASDYNTINKFANSGKLNQYLNQHAKTEILNIVRNEWRRLQTLAANYWNNDRPAQTIQVVEGPGSLPCTHGHCNGTVPLVINEFTKKREKQKCDTCYTIQ